VAYASIDGNSQYMSNMSFCYACIYSVNANESTGYQNAQGFATRKKGL
jgi:hypothetical protein